MSPKSCEPLRSEYDNMDAITVTEVVENQDLIGYDLNFIYLDLTSTAVVRAFNNSRATYVIFFQGEDRELEQIRAVFEAITVSLLRDL